MQPRTPHPLTAGQADVLLHLLRHDLPGYDVLRRQVPHARVTKYWYDPSPSFDMDVADGVSASGLPDGNHADAEWGWTPDGEVEGNLIVWLEDGLLAGLEYAVVADEYPEELPAVSLIREPLHGEKSASALSRLPVAALARSMHARALDAAAGFARRLAIRGHRTGGQGRAAGCPRDCPDRRR